MDREEYIASIMQIGLDAYWSACGIAKNTDLNDLKKKVVVMDTMQLITPEEYYDIVCKEVPFDKLPYHQRRFITTEITLYLKGKQLYSDIITQGGKICARSNRKS